MENEKALKYSWNFLFSCPPYFSSVRLPGIAFIYRTEKIQIPTTTEEIAKSSQSFLKETIEKYNSYQIPGEKTILTTYRLHIRHGEEEKEEIQQPEEKDLYESIYKIEEKEKIQIEEKKKYRPSQTIPPNFYIFLVATVYFYRERQHNPNENEDEEKKNLLKISKCLICRKNRVNVLFKRCFHMVLCKDCDQSNNCNFCPLCKNNLGGTRKEIFLSKKVYYTSAVVSRRGASISS